MEIKKMRKMMFLFGIALILVSMNGCSKPPQADIDGAKAAIDAARSADAGTYAPNSLRAAEDAQAQLEAELKAQEDKFSLFRSYKKASELAAVAKAAGEKAQADAKAGKEQKKNEAQTAISEAKTMLEEAKTDLASAPTGKGTQPDPAAMKADLDGVAATIAEAESAFNAEKYTDAKAKADSAKQTIQNVKSSIEQAKAAKAAAKTAHGAHGAHGKK